jgi:hypothetical protein
MPANKAYLRYASPLCVRSKDRDPSGLANPSSNSGGSQMCDALRIEIASPQTRTNLERYWVACWIKTTGIETEQHEVLETESFLLGLTRIRAAPRGNL